MRNPLLRMIRANQKFQNNYKQREFHLGWNRQSQQHHPIFKGLVVLVKYLDPSLKTFNEKTFPTVLQNPSTIFCERLNDKAPLELENFKHLSKKRHDHSPRFEKNISYWSKHLPAITIEDWKRTLVHISHLHYSNHTLFNQAFEFYWGYSQDASTKYAPSALLLMKDYTTPFSTAP